MPSTAAPVGKAPRAVRGTGRFALVTAACIVIATAVNLALYAVGRATGASLRVDPGFGKPNHLIIVGDVAWKTAVSLALGAVVLALIARRSRRWVTITIVAGAAVVSVSIPFVVIGAHDAITGVLLASMHTITGLTYVLIGTRVLRSISSTVGADSGLQG